MSFFRLRPISTFFDPPKTKKRTSETKNLAKRVDFWVPDVFWQKGQKLDKNFENPVKKWHEVVIRGSFGTLGSERQNFCKTAKNIKIFIIFTCFSQVFTEKPWIYWYSNNACVKTHVCRCKHVCVLLDLMKKRLKMSFVLWRTC